MTGHPLLLRLVWLLLALVVVPSGLATTTPQDVLTDWAFDGKVDGQTDPDPQIDVTHTYSDLQKAKGLIQAQDPASAIAVIPAIQEAIERDYLGIKPPQADPTPSAPAVDIPDWVTAAAIASGLLVVAGVASAIYRRTRRPA